MTTSMMQLYILVTLMSVVLTVDKYMPITAPAPISNGSNIKTARRRPLQTRAYQQHEIYFSKRLTEMHIYFVMCGRIK